MRRRLLASLAATAAVAASLLISSAGPATAADSAAAAPEASAANVSSGGATADTNLLPPIQVNDPSLKIVATLRGVGKQVYDCTGGKYVFREPVAGLFGPRGLPVGIHGAVIGAGPFWTNFDGSRVDGTVVGKVDAPKPSTDIQWLKVEARSTSGTGGTFSKVKFIQRIDTKGGVAPATCGAPTIAVDYTTNYVFWAPK
jgi:hypothetical protein